jgi:hypothetical protein
MPRPLLYTTALILLIGCDRTPTGLSARGQPPLFSTTAGTLSFSNTPLLQTAGSSEPAIAIAADGTMGVTALSWLERGTRLWTGSFGSTPTFQGLLDASLQQPGKRLVGGQDADVDIGATGTLHAATAVAFFNQQIQGHFQYGISAITCPRTSSGFDLATCSAQIIDKTTADRPWITSDGANVYIAYHDAQDASLVHVVRSDDDGLTWRRVSDPIVGQDGATGDATFNNLHGPIVADPSSHNLYTIYVAGEAGLQKGTTFDFNNIYVTRSTDGGGHWHAVRVFHAPVGSHLNNFWPALAVDPTNGQVHAAWSDRQTVSYATSTDAGNTWSVAVAVNTAPATTAVFAWVAAHDGVADVVYYATTAASNADPNAVWNVYLAQTANGGADFEQSLVSNSPNHVGVLCTLGIYCSFPTRTLLDLFEVAIDPTSGRAAVAYVDDAHTQTPWGAPLPQVVLAQQQ